MRSRTARNASPRARVWPPSDSGPGDGPRHRHKPQWGALGRVLAGEGIAAALSVPVELDGSPIGTLDIYSSMPWDWDDSEIAAAQAYAGVVASLFAAAVTAQAKSRLADQLRAALEHRWLIEQAKEMLMGRERLDAQAAFERLPRTARSSPGGWTTHPNEYRGLLSRDGIPLGSIRLTLNRVRVAGAEPV
jgi:hypothetical protein